jgi:Mg-chelatase subunit ChlD
MGRRSVAAMLTGISCLAQLVRVLPLPAEGTISPEALVVVTEDRLIETDGCDAVSVFRADTAEAVFRGETHASPGRLAATSDLRVVLATPSNGAVVNVGGRPWQEFLYVAGVNDPRLERWSSGVVLGTEVATFGGVAVLPGDQEFLVATSGKEMHRGMTVLLNKVPFAVRKYALPKRIVPQQTIGPLRGQLTLEALPVEILVAPDGHHAHILTDRMSVHTVDYHTMRPVGTPIQLPAFISRTNVYFGTAINRMHGALSPDGRYLVTNRGDSNELNVADLDDRTSWTLATRPDIESIGGVAFDWRHLNSELLAIHANDKVFVYQWSPPGPLIEIGRVAIAAPRLLADPLENDCEGPKNSIAWSGDGSALIAATDVGSAEFIIVDVPSGGGQPRLGLNMEACSHASNLPNDIVTTNGLRPPPTPTPAPSATLTPAPTPTTTPSETSTPTQPAPSATPTPSAASTPTATVNPAPTTAPTPTPTPIYLPLALRARCVPGKQRIDLALVIDASTTMRDDRTSTGRSKLEAATEAARVLVDTLALPLDQAAVVTFSSDAALLVGLTGRRTEIEAALGRIAVERQTRIDRGIAVAHEELTGPRRRAGSAAVMVVLTDGLANPEPASTAVARAGAAKGDGITVFTIGLGRDADLDVAALEQMASRREYCYRAPDGEDLLAIYAAIAVEIPCPAEEYWGRR